MTGTRDWHLLRRLRRATSERSSSVQWERPLKSRSPTERATDRAEDMGRLVDLTDSRGQPISMPKLRFLGDQP